MFGRKNVELNCLYNCLQMTKTEVQTYLNLEPFRRKV